MTVLASVTFTVDDADPEHIAVLAIHPEDGEIGWMTLFDEEPVGRIIDEITVVPAWRRKGIATRLWERAMHLGLRPAHSSYRTEMGDAWAATVSDYLPPRIS